MSMRAYRHNICIVVRITLSMRRIYWESSIYAVRNNGTPSRGTTGCDKLIQCDRVGEYITG